MSTKSNRLPARYDFKSHYEGDTFVPPAFRYSIDGTPVDLTGYSVLIEFRSVTPSGTVVESLSSNDSEISVDSEGNITIDPYIPSLPTGEYFWDLRVTSPTGIVTTLWAGTWTIRNFYG